MPDVLETKDDYLSGVVEKRLRITAVKHLDQCSSTGVSQNPRIPQNMLWGSVRVSRFLGEMIFASVC